jgi:hypothetical protein
MPGGQAQECDQLATDHGVMRTQLAVLVKGHRESLPAVRRFTMKNQGYRLACHGARPVLLLKLVLRPLHSPPGKYRRLTIDKFAEDVREGG